MRHCHRFCYRYKFAEEVEKKVFFSVLSICQLCEGWITLLSERSGHFNLLREMCFSKTPQLVFMQVVFFYLTFQESEEYNICSAWFFIRNNFTNSFLPWGSILLSALAQPGVYTTSKLPGVSLNCSFYILHVANHLRASKSPKLNWGNKLFGFINSKPDSKFYT